MTTLCYIEKDDSYLMMHRTVKKNDVNKDKWIGVGGHAELGESPEECLLREVKEETGYTLTSWRFRGLVTFVTEAENSKTVEYMEYMCLYTADGFTGEPTACDEGELAWVKKEDILSALIRKRLNKYTKQLLDRKSTRLNSSHRHTSRMPSSA